MHKWSMDEKIKKTYKNIDNLGFIFVYSTRNTRIY